MTREPFLTIFTPTFNRKETLIRTYKSLCNQSCKEFIWLIVDDGSSDQTGDLVKDWMQKDNGFSIRYIYKENGGMHTAHNAAYSSITTELNTCIDSDDCLAAEAVAVIKDFWFQIRGKGYAGIIALDGKMNENSIIGKGFPLGLSETTVSGYYQNGGFGDKKLIYRTEVICNYPEYPVFEKEKYFSLAYKYLLIDQDYKMAVLDKIVCLVDYQPDGSTNTMFRQYLDNPRGFAFWRTIRMKYDTSIKRRIRDCIHYCSSSQIAGIRDYISQSPYPFLTVLCTPAGWALTAMVRKKALL